MSTSLPSPNANTNTTTLPPQNRYITTHNAHGLSVFSTLPSPATFSAINANLDFFLAYTNAVPPNMTAFADLTAYQSIFSAPEQPSITIPGGTVLRVCNLAPAWTSAMHRTLSLDFGIVVAGEVELVLDSGETRLLTVGDIAVQRGTMHAWRVPSADKWARMVFVLHDSPALRVAGRDMVDDYGGIEVQSADSFVRGSR